MPRTPMLKDFEFSCRENEGIAREFQEIADAKNISTSELLRQLIRRRVRYERTLKRKRGENV